jgi:anti-sigma B factor antagonist
VTEDRLIRAGPLTLRVNSRDGDGVRIEAGGELDMATASALHKQLFDDGLGPDQRITLDLSGLTFIDSCGIKEIIRAHERLNDGKVRFSLARAEGQVAEVFAITGADEFLVFLD